jgi:PAS domain S-box-containing protein
LLRQKIPSRWIATLLDSRQIVLARSRDAARHVGHSVEPLLGKIASRRSEAFLSVQRQNEMSVYAAVNRSPLSGWSLALIVPRSEIDAILRRSLGAVVIGGLSLLGLGVAVALLFARQVSRSVARLSSVAHELGGGRLTAAAVDTPIAELNDLASEMERAAALLRERESQRDRVEAALREQEEFLKRQADLLNLANEAIFAWDQDGTIIFWNRGAEQLYGFSQGEAIGQANDRLLSMETAPAQESLSLALAAHGEWFGEVVQKTKNGRRIVVESRIKMITDRAGRRIALECARDVTSRKRAAQRLAVEQAVTRTLAESPNLDEASTNILQAIAEGMSWEVGFFWEASKATETLRGSAWWQAGGDGFAHFIENKRHQTFAKGVGLPGRVWAGEQPVWIADLAQEREDLGQPSAIRFGLRSAFAFPIMLHREVFAVLEFFGRGVREKDAEWLKVAQGIGSEIGQFVERIRAEEALRASETRLRNQAQELEEQLLASGRLVAVGELTASMAHEFNNPLGIILGFAQGLLAGLDPSDPNRRHVQIIAEEAKRCERLVQELLEFGRPSKGEFAPIDIGGVIAKTMELVQNRASASDVETATEIAPDLPRIRADAQQLQQVLLNLCLNAIDAMPRGGKLTVRATQEGDSAICLTVVDTGHGIDPDALRKIFQPFFTAKKKRGLGLGLSICDRIVKAHGGTLSASSAPGMGTTFTVRLPVLAEPAPIKRQKQPTAPV